jgi:glutathione synthase
MDHPARLNVASDSSLMLIEEATRRGHRTFFYEASALRWQQGVLSAPLAPIAAHTKDATPWTLGDARQTPLTDMHVVLMRQDPPFDMGYITATHLLEQLPAATKVWNNPAGVRNCPEKLSILGSAQYMPPTLISRDAASIEAFAREHEAVIAKPLYGYGGRSVFKFAAADGNLETFLEYWSEASKEPLMWQAFLPEVREGDRRVLMVNGEVDAVFGRAPAAHSIRANMRVGGTPVKATLTPKQEEICHALSPFLRTHGLMLAGIDLIGDYLTEINVTSPTGLRAAEALYGVNLATRFWEAVENAA